MLLPGWRHLLILSMLSITSSLSLLSTLLCTWQVSRLRPLSSSPSWVMSPLSIISISWSPGLVCTQGHWVSSARLRPSIRNIRAGDNTRVIIYWSLKKRADYLYTCCQLCLQRGSDNVSNYVQNDGICIFTLLLLSHCDLSGISYKQNYQK